MCMQLKTIPISQTLKNILNPNFSFFLIYMVEVRDKKTCAPIFNDSSPSVSLKIFPIQLSKQFILIKDNLCPCKPSDLMVAVFTRGISK